jgi:hypothetical protein
MKPSKLIEQAQAILAEHGDLECLSEETYSIHSVEMEESEGQYPEDWQLPEGTKFCKINESR